MIKKIKQWWKEHCRRTEYIQDLLDIIETNNNQMDKDKEKIIYLGDYVEGMKKIHNILDVLPAYDIAPDVLTDKICHLIDKMKQNKAKRILEHYNTINDMKLDHQRKEFEFDNAVSALKSIVLKQRNRCRKIRKMFSYMEKKLDARFVCTRPVNPLAVLNAFVALINAVDVDKFQAQYLVQSKKRTFCRKENTLSDRYVERVINKIFEKNNSDLTQ